MTAAAWDLSCRDWEQRLMDGRSLVPDLPFLNRAEGNRAVAAFDKLQLADVPGTPTMKEACGDWFRDIVRAIFGSVDHEQRLRFITEAFCLVPKKNSKTTNSAGLALVAMLLNQRPNARMALTAPVQDTADIAFSALSGAIALDPVLDRRFHVRDHLKEIVDRTNKAKLEIMTFDPAVLTGGKYVFTLVDELHEIALKAKADKALRQIRGGTIPFFEAFVMFITTQSDGAPVGIFKEELTAARAIRDGRRQGKMLPVLYEFPEKLQKGDEKAWRNPKLWHLVNPNLGKAITLDKLVELADAEEQKSEASFRGWATQHLNVQVGVAIMSDGWAGALFWDVQAEAAGLTLQQLIDRSEVITVGMDGGGLDDLLGLAVIGRDKGTREWLTWTHAWAHPTVLDRRKSEAPRFLDFAKDGDLTLVERIGEDFEQIAGMVETIFSSGKLYKIGMDPAGVGGILDALVSAGVPRTTVVDGKESELIVGISQGWRLGSAIKTTERKLAEGVLVHGGQPLMAWCVGNAKVEPRGNSILITKQASGFAKIDPLMAVFDAVELMAHEPAAQNMEVAVRWI